MVKHSLVKRVTRRALHLYAKQSEKSFFTGEKVENFAKLIFADLGEIRKNKFRKKKVLHKFLLQTISLHHTGGDLHKKRMTSNLIDKLQSLSKL